MKITLIFAIMSAMCVTAQTQLDWSQIKNKPQGTCADTSVSANTIICATATGSIPSYSLGQTISVKMANSNTGATTINVNGLGSKSVTTQSGAPLSAGALTAAGVYLLGYDGAKFQVIAGGGGGGGGAWGGITGTLSSQTDLQAALDAKPNLAGGNVYTGNQTVGASVFNSTGPNITSTDQATPSNPASSKTAVYTKSGVLCALSPAGTETCTGTGGSSVGGVGIVVAGSTVSVDVAVVPTFLTAAASFTISAIANGACSAEQTFTFTGSTFGDAPAVGDPSTLETGLKGFARITAPNTGSFKACNWSGATVTPVAGQTWTFVITRSF